MFVRERDAGIDTVRCGTGTDRAHLDDLDVADLGCESAWNNGRRLRYGVAPAGRPSLLLLADPLLVGRRSGRSTIRLACTKEGRRRCRGTVTIRKRGQRLARASFSLLPGQRRAIAVRLSGEARDLLRRRYRRGTLVRVEIDVVGGRPASADLIASLPLDLRR